MRIFARFFGIAAAVAAIGLLMAGCDSPTGNDVPANVEPGPAATPTSVTVTAPAGQVSQYGSWTFTATVGPAGVPQGVTWSIVPEDAGTISAAGVLVPTADEGTSIAVWATAAGHPTVRGYATVTVSAPVPPGQVTVTPAAVYLRPGQQQQFSAAVGPTGAPAGVEWTVEPPEAGQITQGGMFTMGNTGADTVTIRATAAGTTVSGTATATVPQPITITIHGIPSHHQGISVWLDLLFPGTSNIVAFSGAWLDGDSATFEMRGDGDSMFDQPGNYEVRLEICCCNGGYVYRTGAIQIQSGANTIDWDEFTLVPPVTITITGIPPQYDGGYAFIALMAPGTITFIAGTEAYITGPDLTATMQGAGHGTFDVLLALSSPHWEVLEVYTAPSVQVTDDIVIPFGQFSPRPPSITLTITGIPAEYQGDYAEVQILCHATSTWDDSFVMVTGPSAAARFWLAAPGTFDVYVYIVGTDRWGHFYAEGITLGATATIQWNSLTWIQGGELMRVTVTGIPSEYNDRWVELILRCTESLGSVDGSSTEVQDSSAMFRFSQAGPGLFNVELWVFDGGFRNDYFVEEIYIYHGATIPFDQFDELQHLSHSADAGRARVAPSYGTRARTPGAYPQRTRLLPDRLPGR